MPARHRYKCLNYERCPCYNGASNKIPVFVAMNSPMPQCPHCGARRLEDWGEAIETGIIGGAARAHIQNSDANLRRVAERYGLADMNNRDGQAVKRAAPSAPSSSGRTISVGGYQMPLESVASGACVNMPGLAKPIPVNPKASNAVPKNSPMMRQMTRVVGEHKA